MPERSGEQNKDQQRLREGTHALALGVSHLILAMQAIDGERLSFRGSTHELVKPLLPDSLSCNNGHFGQEQDLAVLQRVNEWFNRRLQAAMERLSPTEK